MLDFVLNLPQPIKSAFPFYTSDLLVLGLAFKAYKSRGLTPLGIAASVATGLIHTHHPTLLPFSLLAGFYLTSSKFTKLKADIKASLTQHSSGEGGGEGPRNATQVFANSIVATSLIFLHTHFYYFVDGSYPWSNLLLIGVICQYAAVCADTWSSELGILSKSNPILITTLKLCPKGTNGGVSPLGLGVALGAGAFIGTISSFFLYSPAQQFLQCGALIAFTSVMGLFGSLLDSVLGATLQQSVVLADKNIIVEGEGGGKLTDIDATKNPDYKVVSGYNILSNNQVNLLTSVITTAVGMGVWYSFFLS